MSAADTPMVPETQPKLSEMERIVNVFTAPSKTFTDILRNANWLVPFILMSIMSVAYVAVVDKKIGWNQVVENKFASMSEKQKDQMEQMPADARARQQKGMLMGYKYGSYASPIFILGFFALFAAIYMLACNFGLGAEVRYKHALAVLVYASLPSILRTLLAIGVVLANSDPTTFNFENPVVTNPGFAVSESAQPALYSFLSKIDVFALWGLYLTGLGLACVGKVKKNSALTVVFGLYAGYVVLAVLFNLAFK